MIVEVQMYDYRPCKLHNNLVVVVRYDNDSIETYQYDADTKEDTIPFDVWLFITQPRLHKLIEHNEYTPYDYDLYK